MFWFLQPILDELKNIRKDTQTLVRLAYMLVLPKPGPFDIRLISDRINNMLVYDCDISPAKPSSELIIAQKIQTQHFVVTRKSDGQVFFDVTLPIEADKIDEFRVPRDTDMVAALTYLDQNSNESTPSIQEWFAKDTIAPDAPGPFGRIGLLADEPDPAV